MGVTAAPSLEVRQGKIKRLWHVSGRFGAGRGPPWSQMGDIVTKKLHRCPILLTLANIEEGEFYIYYDKTS